MADAEHGIERGGAPAGAGSDDIATTAALSERLASQSRVYDRVLSSISDFAYSFDLDGRFTFANRPLLDLWGIALDVAIGKNFAELKYPDDLAATLQRQIGEVIATKHAVVGETPFTSAAGDEGYYQYIFSPVIGPDGSVEAVAGTTRDITEAKRAEEVTRIADRRKDEFLATLAHELRNPLAPVRTGLQVLKISPPGPAADRAREMMERQLTHIVRLIDDLLDVSRIGTGKIELRLGRIDLRSAVASAVETSRSLIDIGLHKLTVTLPAEPVWIDADHTRIAQAVGNLLTNAAKYTPDRGRIDLVARRDGDWAVVSVADSGLGIPAEMRERVFEMFTQVNKTLDRAQGGLGIGLALVKRLLEMHGGTIGVESAGADLGSTFTIRIPVAPAAEAPAVSLSPAAGTPAARRILVVDDNQDGAESLTLLLTIQGHTVRTAYSGVQAIEVAHAFRPDIAFLDIGLPGMDGHEVARRFRADRALSGIALIALTGWGSDDDKTHSREAGFDFHITKPAEPEEIERVCADVERMGKDRR